MTSISPRSRRSVSRSCIPLTFRVDVKIKQDDIDMMRIERIYCLPSIIRF